MAEFAEMRAGIRELISKLRGFGLTEPLERELRQCADDLDSECVVVVSGEFSRGKSSMLNALVGRPGLFPVGIDVTTAVVTELRWGERESAEVWIGEDKETVTIPAVSGYITEQDNPANVKDVRLVRLTSPLKLIKHGMVLVDTPGIGSLNVEHATAAYAALGTADAVLFVGAADERMSTPELSSLVGAMNRCPIVITVLTKTDKLYDPGPELEVARERIAKASEKDPDEILVTAVSARRMHDAIRSHDEDLLNQSGFPRLEELLTTSLAATWGRMRLNRALDVVSKVFDQVTAPVRNELLALGSDEALAQVHAELDRIRARAAELTGAAAGWTLSARPIPAGRGASPTRWSGNVPPVWWTPWKRPGRACATRASKSPRGRPSRRDCSSPWWWGCRRSRSSSCGCRPRSPTSGIAPGSLSRRSRPRRSAPALAPRWAERSAR